MPSKSRSASQSHNDGVTDVTASAADGSSAPAASPRRGRPPAATPAELAASLRKLLGGASVLVALLAGIDEIALEESEAEAIAGPLARMLNKSKLLKRFSKSMSGGSDAIDLAFALLMYALRVVPAIRAKTKETAQRVATGQARPLQQHSSQSAAAAASASSTGAGAAAPDYDASAFLGYSDADDNAAQAWTAANAG